MKKQAKIAGAILLVIVTIFVGNRIWTFFVEEKQLSSDLSDIQTRLTQAKSDEASLEANAQYLADPVNLEKELRARFNYKKPGETMIVIVPPASSTATSSEQ